MHSTPQKIQRRWLALALLCTAQFMVVLDSSIVNIALPSIQKDLVLSIQNLQWIVTAYSLTAGGFLLPGGRLADLYGRRRLFTIGLITFTLASLVGGLAPSGLWLIVARAVQGLGAALVLTTALSLITTTFTEGQERNKALGVVGAVTSLGFAAGAILGGLLTSGLGWRSVLFVNVPIGIAALLLVPVLLSESRAEMTDRRVDVLGAISVTAGLMLLVYALTRGNELGWLTGQTLGLLLFAFALLVAFVIIELRSPFPLVRLGIFRIRTVTGANLVALLATGVFSSLLYILTLYMQRVLGYSAIQAGLAFLPLAAAVLIMAYVSSNLAVSRGVKPFIIGGLVVFAIGILLLSGLSPQGTYVGTLLPGILVAALGAGSVLAAIIIAATMGVSNNEQGLASGLYNTTSQVGAGLCVAITAAVAASRSIALTQSGVSNGVAALTGGFQYALYVCVGLTILSIFTALLGIQGNTHSDKKISASSMLDAKGEYHADSLPFQAAKDKKEMRQAE